MHVRVKPLSNRLREHIRKHGDLWKVVHTGPMLCFNGQTGFKLIALDDATVLNVTREMFEPVEDTYVSCLTTISP